MISYTIKKGDTLSQIAYRYQTTTAILMGDNPEIKDINVIIAGKVIKIRTSEEFAKDKVAAAKKSVANAVSTQPTSTSSGTIPSNATSATWNGVGVMEGQTGVVTITRKTNLYTIDSKGNLKVLRTTVKNNKYRSYGTTSVHGGLYILGGAYVKKADATYEALPANYKVGEAVAGSATVVHDSTNSGKTIVAGESFSPTTPHFQMPGYRRTRMQVKKSDGSTLTMELRVLDFQKGYSNQIGPSRTNEGWMLNIGGKNLSNISISGFLLDTTTNREADDFLTNYNSHFTPKNSGDYFSAALTTILHKNREYKGLIESVNISDQSSTPLDRKFALRFLVLSEKIMYSTHESAKTFTVERNGESEVDFMSSLKNMLTNPITGKFNTHN